jgi:glycosyltransferase involved in cell wall biosynthesis
MVRSGLNTDLALTLTVVIPTMDRPDYLRSAVASALFDLPDDGRVIVVDDRGSIPAITSLAATNDDRLKIFVNQAPKGPSGARNFGVKLAQTNLVTFLDDDDLIQPGYLNWIIEMAKNARYGFCSTQNFGANGPKISNFASQGVVPVNSLPFKQKLAGLGCGFWIYRSDFNALNGLDTSLEVNEDTDFSIKLLAKGLKGAKEFGVGVMIRQHSPTSGAQNVGHVTRRTNASVRADNFAHILQTNASYFTDNPDEANYIRKRMIKMHAKAGSWSEGINGGKGRVTLLAYFLFNWLIYQII